MLQQVHARSSYVWTAREQCHQTSLLLSLLLLFWIRQRTTWNGEKSLWARALVTPFRGLQGGVVLEYFIDKPLQEHYLFYISKSREAAASVYLARRENISYNIYLGIAKITSPLSGRRRAAGSKEREVTVQYVLVAITALRQITSSIRHGIKFSFNIKWNTRLFSGEKIHPEYIRTWCRYPYRYAAPAHMHFLTRGQPGFISGWATDI